MSAEYKRRGVTLLELLVVVVLMGIFAAIAAARFGTAILGDFSAKADGRNVSLDLLRAQRSAIMTGDNHYLAFTISGGKATGYQIYRRLSNGTLQAIDSFRPFNDKLTVTVSHNEFEYNFEGQALAAYQIALNGPHRSATLNIVPITGAVRWTET